MRQYKILLQKFLRNSIYNFRIQNRYTQEKMAELLGISPRSYIDQEHGKYGFSALSVIFYLLVLSEDEVYVFLEQFRRDLEQEEKKSYHTV